MVLHFFYFYDSDAMISLFGKYVAYALTLVYLSIMTISAALLTILICDSSFTKKCLMMAEMFH